MDLVNEWIAGAMAHARLRPVAEGFEWSWDDDDDLNRIVWPVAKSAADLLAEGDLGRVRKCGSHDCTWLFYDTSKNRSRRWCDMKGCGNRAKARRHYEKRKKTTNKHMVFLGVPRKPEAF
jgi:predicted RNA-binding Zn ribbon-like protein